MREFKPTWLYVKKHSITGLMYFGKSTLEDPINYTGSGKYWKNHINVHGKHIQTIWCELFTDYDSLVDFAELFSSLFDIVKSDKWANLILENGLDGGSDKGRSGHIFSEEARRKISIANTGRVVSEEHRDKLSKALIGKSRSEETKQKIRNNRNSISEDGIKRISAANKGKIVSKETRQKLSEAASVRKREPLSEETKLKISNTMRARSHLTSVYNTNIIADDK